MRKWVRLGPAHEALLMEEWVPGGCGPGWVLTGRLFVLSESER